MPTQPAAKTIADYKAAFRAVNDVPCPHISYSHGWFRFHRRSGENRFREMDMLRMIDVLQRRASTHPQPAKG